MLSIFPTLLDFQLLAPLILRLTIGVIFFLFGYAKLTRQKSEKISFFENVGMKPGLVYVFVIGIVEMIAGIFLVAGFLTQIAALVVVIILLGALYLKKKYPTSFESSSGYLFLCLVIALSLLFTGPGFLAFDLPL